MIYNQIVTWTAFATLAMFSVIDKEKFHQFVCVVSLYQCLPSSLHWPLKAFVLNGGGGEQGKLGRNLILLNQSHLLLDQPINPPQNELNWNEFYRNETLMNHHQDLRYAAALTTILWNVSTIDLYSCKGSEVWYSCICVVCLSLRLCVFLWHRCDDHILSRHIWMESCYVTWN